MITRRYFLSWIGNGQRGSSTFWIKTWLPQTARFIYTTAISLARSDANSQDVTLVALNKL